MRGAFSITLYECIDECIASPLSKIVARQTYICRMLEAAVQAAVQATKISATSHGASARCSDGNACIALLRPVLAECDAAHLPAYLESTGTTRWAMPFNVIGSSGRARSFSFGRRLRWQGSQGREARQQPCCSRTHRQVMTNFKETV